MQQIELGISKSLRNSIMHFSLLSDYVRMPKTRDIDYIIPTPQELQALLTELEKCPEYEAILTCAVLGYRCG